MSPKPASMASTAAACPSGERRMISANSSASRMTSGSIRSPIARASFAGAAEIHQHRLLVMPRDLVYRRNQPIVRRFSATLSD